jgi:hypothetical protein
MDRGFAIVAGIPVETCGNSVCQRDQHVAEGQRLCPQWVPVIASSWENPFLGNRPDASLRAPQVGYSLNDRVIRPADVGVVKGRE